MAKAYRRRNYFTKKGFQSRFMLRFIVASVLANALSVTLFIFLAKNKIDSLLFSMRLPQASAGAILSPEAFLASIVAVVCISILFLLAARSMYDKISAPLHQIRTDLHTIGKGDLSCRVSLRDIDEFKDFAGEINTMTGELHSRFSVIHDQVNDLAKSAKALKSAHDPGESQAVIGQMKNALSSLEERIRVFKI
jgi:methyl-accepting chemotaxis protein